MADGTDSDREELRRLARERLERKQAFWVMLGVALLVCGVVTAIWALTGQGYFWPVWTYFGMAIPVAILGWIAYGPRVGEISEADVDREIKRMGR